MSNAKEPIRKTIYIEEELVKKAGILFGVAEVDSFSAFVTKAIDSYITRLVADKSASYLTEEVRKVIKDELATIKSRLSRSLYKYAVELNMLAQAVAYQHEFSRWDIRDMRNEAQAYVAQTNGVIRVEDLLGKVYGKFYEE